MDTRSPGFGLSLKNLQDSHCNDILGTDLPGVLKYLHPTSTSWEHCLHAA